MFKIYSKSSLIQTVPIIDSTGREVSACIFPHGSITTRRITPQLQYLIENNQISVVETSETSERNKENQITSENKKDSGSFNESMNITEFNSQEEKEKFDEMSNDLEEKPKRGRRKKNVGDVSNDN